MAESKVAGPEVEVIGWAAHDKTGVLSPWKFERRATGPKDVRFDITFCGVCHTDLHHARNDFGRAIYPMVPGHEIVGIVTEVGSEVTKFKVGDRVGVGCLVNSCGSCSSCEEGAENYCLAHTVLTYSDVDFDGCTTYGGYSNKMVVLEDYALKIPDNLPMDKAAPLLCAGITVYSPLMYFGMNKPGKKFGVVGLGGVGHVAVKIGKAFGMHVTVISSSIRKKTEAIEDLGADAFLVSSDPEQMKKACMSLDYILDTVSANHAMDDYLSLLKVNGKLVVVGFPPKIDLAPTSMSIARKMLAGSVVGGIAETQDMLNFCAKHNITCNIETIGIDYINKAMDRLEKSDVRYRFVIDIANSLKAS